MDNFNTRKPQYLSRKNWWANRLKEISQRPEFNKYPTLHVQTLNKIATILTKQLNKLVLKMSYERSHKEISKRLGCFIKHNNRTTHLTPKQLLLFHSYVEQVSKTELVKAINEQGTWTDMARVLKLVISSRAVFEADRKREKQIYNNYILSNTIEFPIFLRSIVSAIDKQLNIQKIVRYKDKSFEICASIINLLPLRFHHKVTPTYIKAIVAKLENYSYSHEKIKKTSSFNK